MDCAAPQALPTSVCESVHLVECLSAGAKVEVVGRRSHGDANSRLILATTTAQQSYTVYHHHRRQRPCCRLSPIAFASTSVIAASRSTCPRADSASVAGHARHVRSVSRIAPRRFCVELIYVLMAGEAAREAAGMRHRETGGF